MARAPQPVPHFQSFEPPSGPAPLSGFWLGVAAATLAVASAVAAFFTEIAARWRGIVVAHLFFLTLWMAVQVFFFATGAFWCLPSNGSRMAEWLIRSFGAVARCGGGSAVFRASAAAAPAPAVPSQPSPIQPGPDLASANLDGPPRPPAVIAAAPPQAASPASSPGSQPDPTYGIHPPAFGSSSGWSARTITNCWRNRSIGSGDCYQTTDQRRRSAPPQRYQHPDQRRYTDQPPRPANPCRHPYDCWPADFSRGSDL